MVESGDRQVIRLGNYSPSPNTGAVSKGRSTTLYGGVNLKSFYMLYEITKIADF